MPRDAEAQTRSPVAARDRGIGLREFLEDDFLLVLGDADAGVGHVTPQHDMAFAIRLAVDGQGDGTALGVFYRIADQIDHDPGEARRIAGQVGDAAGRKITGKDQALVAGEGRHGFHDAVDDIRKREHDVFDLKLPGFDLGYVEEVVDDDQQVLGGAVGDARHIAMLGVDALVLMHQARQPDNAVQGRPKLVRHMRQEV